MSQPHPPIPEPQPHGEADDPRTRSILLPPSQREAAPAPEWAPTGEQSPGQPLPGQPVPPQPVPGPPGTSEFPAPGYEQPGYDPATSTQVTGPVDFVPGFTTDPHRPAPAGSSAVSPPPPPGPGTPPGSPGAPSAPRRSPLAALQGAGRHAVLPLVLGVLGLVLLELGLVLDYGNQSLWDVVPTWSAFATVAALLVLVPAVAGLTGRLPARSAWRVGAAGLAGLAAAWVLVALPLVASDRGFWLTGAVAAAGAALWLAPGRPQ